jgi:hypothetical protein
MTTSKPTRSAISSASFLVAKDQTQVNEKIRAKELRLIGQDGEQIGVKTKNVFTVIHNSSNRWFSVWSHNDYI